MPWFLLAILSTVSLSISVLYLRVAMKEEESDPIVSSIFFQFVLGGIITVYAVLQGLTMPPMFLWPRYVMSAVFYAAGTYLGFKAAKKVGAAEMTIVGTVGSVVSIILGVFILRESFGPIRFIGAILILGSIIYLYTGKKLRFPLGSWYVVGSAVLYACAGVNDVFVIKAYDPVSYVALMSFLPGVVLLCAQPKAIFKLGSQFVPKTFRTMFLYCFFYAIQAITYYLALSRGAGISQLAPITRSEIVLVVILAAVFLGERKDLRKKIISTILVTLGVSLLA